LFIFILMDDIFFTYVKNEVQINEQSVTDR
jgi:hypothetical protein